MNICSAGFYGNGFIELPSHSLRKRANFGLVFRTLQPNCLILLSAFPPAVSSDGIEFDQKELRGNYSVSLYDGRAHIWLNAGREPIELQSNVTLNDGEYHVLIVQKTGRKFELRIDDETQAINSFASQPFVINMPEERGGLYFGSAPDYPEYDHLAKAFEPFEGAIKDVVFNNHTIHFNEFRNFSNVQMGRSGPVMGYQWALKTESISKSFTAVPEGCHRVSFNF